MQPQTGRKPSVSKAFSSHFPLQNPTDSAQVARQGRAVRVGRELDRRERGGGELDVLLRHVGAAHPARHHQPSVLGTYHLSILSSSSPISCLHSDSPQLVADPDSHRDSPTGPGEPDPPLQTPHEASLAFQRKLIAALVEILTPEQTKLFVQRMADMEDVKMTLQGGGGGEELGGGRLRERWEKVERKLMGGGGGESEQDEREAARGETEHGQEREEQARPVGGNARRFTDSPPEGSPAKKLRLTEDGGDSPAELDAPEMGVGEVVPEQVVAEQTEKELEPGAVAVAEAQPGAQDVAEEAAGGAGSEDQ